MSGFVFVAPMDDPEVAEFYGLKIPAVTSRPSVAEVLDALRAAGCCGANWFAVLGEDAGARLPEDGGEFDLGEVTISSPGQETSFAADARFESAAFRKPDPAAAQVAARAVASVAGPVLVLDEQGEHGFVVEPEKKF
ncbi:hypothetical protein [Cryptosporangium sp. NPDC048952]|uniref:hypothetical protein n=1 Tax=Cryptosporangium sp. NPDC048952 TaxID=3363961 RepID=UPI0037214645